MEREKRDTGWEHWRKREREKEARRTRKKRGKEQAGKELVDICAELKGGWGVGGRAGMATLGCSAVSNGCRGPAEIDASRGSSLIYAFITVNNASPFASGLSFSLSVSLSLVSRRHSISSARSTEVGYHSTPVYASISDRLFLKLSLEIFTGNLYNSGSFFVIYFYDILDSCYPKRIRYKRGWIGFLNSDFEFRIGFFFGLMGYLESCAINVK